MNNSSSLTSNRSPHRRGIPVWSLAVATVIGVCGTAGSVAVSAQETVGSIFGRAPAGETVVARSTETGFQRHGEVNSKGRYTLSSLPNGMYTVMLEESGRAVLEHLNVGVVVGRGIEVDFDCAKYQCAQHAGKS